MVGLRLKNGFILNLFTQLQGLQLGQTLIREVLSGFIKQGADLVRIGEYVKMWVQWLLCGLYPNDPMCKTMAGPY